MKKKISLILIIAFLLNILSLPVWAAGEAVISCHVSDYGTVTVIATFPSAYNGEDEIVIVTTPDDRTIVYLNQFTIQNNTIKFNFTPSVLAESLKVSFRGAVNAERIFDYDKDGDGFKVPAEEIEEYLNNKYYRYTKGEYTLTFDYEVFVNSKYAKVDMKGRNFTLDSTAWETRDSSKFQEFLDQIAKDVIERNKSDVQIYLYDEEGTFIEKFTYYYDDLTKESDLAKELQETLQEDYGKYTGGEETLRFDFTVTEGTNYFKVVMRGTNFEKNDDAWEGRNNKKFENWIKEIGREIGKATGKDSRFYIYDMDDTILLRYEYDYSDDSLDTLETKSDTSFLADKIKELKDLLNRDFYKFSDGKYTIEFRYEVKNRDSYIRIEMTAPYIKSSSEEWKNRDEDAFKEFLDSIGEKALNTINKDFRIFVYDKDGKLLADEAYDYDPYLDYDTDITIDTDRLAKDLNSYYGRYTEGREELKFSYKVQKASSYIKVTMKGTNFTQSDSAYVNRGEDSFEGFLRRIAIYVIRETGEDVKIYVYDKNNKLLLTKTYNREDDASKNQVAGSTYLAYGVNKFGISVLEPITAKKYGNNRAKLDTESLVIREVSNRTEVSVKGTEIEKAIKGLSSLYVKELLIDLGDKASEYRLTLDNTGLQALINNQVELQVISNGLQLKIPMEMFNLEALGSLLNSKASNVSFRLTVKAQPEEEAKNYKDTAVGKMFQIELDAVAEGKSLTIDDFGGYTITGIIDLEDTDLFVDTSKLTVVRQDENTGEWEVCYSLYNKDNKTVTFRTSKFAKFIAMENNISFYDLGEGHWAKNQVEVLAAKGIVSGTGYGEFTPNKPITRAEFATLLVKAFDLKGSNNNPFYDVADELWYAKPIALCFYHGLISGDGRGNFMPNKSITREEMAVMIVKAYEKEKGTIGMSQLPFADSNKIAAWAKESVAKASALGLVKGNNNKFNPKANATRAEGAVMIYNLLEALGRI